MAKIYQLARVSWFSWWNIERIGSLDRREGKCKAELFESGCVNSLERKWTLKVRRLKNKNLVHSVKKVIARNRKGVKKNLSVNTEGEDPEKGTVLPTGIQKNLELVNFLKTWNFRHGGTEGTFFNVYQGLLFSSGKKLSSSKSSQIFNSMVR